ncbi:carbohydrate ABC transporter permease [Microlunatus soli]|uniref:Carbohydrate ABC transporter membrane protein 2, CUT1 family n=1 Tax=Microlunatus soli TaxID=630515 RepID=A0A1H1UIS2_9ACTN|nr:carbohydrate ABC transporter permease [Microlunatus soli]SDS72106.1 carbohydrate ABC transporter membrane protein 2, CUT1 family [Microlunatus soli]
MTTGTIASTPKSVRSSSAGNAPPRRRKRPGRIRRIITYVVLTPVSLIWIYPFIWMMSASVKPNSKVFADLGIFPTKFFFSNYAEAWVNGNIGRFFINSVVVSVGGVIIVVLTTASMGYVLGRYRFPGKKIVIATLAGLAILPQGYTIIPIFDLIDSLHLDGTLFGIIIAESGSAHIIQLLLYAGYFAQLPAALEEQAKIDGAGYFRIFFTIFLPLAAPATATVIILQFIASWNDFLLPLVLTLSQPDLQTLAVGVYSFQGENMTDYAQMSAASTISLVPVIVVFLFFQRYFVEGLAGAVKQ